jgi:Phytanoyl-CoA dioxygenase (PhyH)
VCAHPTHRGATHARRHSEGLVAEETQAVKARLLADKLRSRPSTSALLQQFTRSDAHDYRSWAISGNLGGAVFLLLIVPLLATALGLLATRLASPSSPVSAHAFAAELLGREVLPGRVKGTRYFGDTGWHRDSKDALPTMGFLAYLEPMTAQSGAIRLLPGSHADLTIALPTSFDDGSLPPGQAIGTEPGDVIAFDEHLVHGSKGGRARRQWRADFLADPQNAEEEDRNAGVLRAHLSRPTARCSLRCHPLPQLWALLEDARPTLDDPSTRSRGLQTGGGGRRSAHRTNPRRQGWVPASGQQDGQGAPPFQLSRGCRVALSAGLLVNSRARWSARRAS